MMKFLKKIFKFFNKINTINEFEKYLEKLDRDTKEDLEKKLIEIEKKLEKIFVEYKNKRNFPNKYYYDYILGKLTKEEYNRKNNQYQKDIENAIEKVENNEMTYLDFFNFIYNW